MTRGGIDLALVLATLRGEPERAPWDPLPPDIADLTVERAAAKVVALMDAEATQLAQDPRQLAFPFAS